VEALREGKLAQRSLHVKQVTLFAMHIFLCTCEQQKAPEKYFSAVQLLRIFEENTFTFFLTENVPCIRLFRL